MSYDYFYGQSGELFSYFRIPKALFQDSRFRQLSTDARTLYGILLDRMSLSAKNNWLDEQGRVYIIYTVREVQESLCCAEHKAVKLFRELEQANLIERKRRGLGRPSLIGRIRIDGELLPQVLSVGISALLMQILTLVQQTVIYRVASNYGGETSQLLLAAALRFWNFSFVPLWGISQGFQPAAGTNYGAKDYDRVKTLTRVFIIAATLLSLVFYIPAELFPEKILSMFLTTPGIAASGATNFRIMFSTYILQGSFMIAVTLFQSLGKAKKATWLVLFRQIILFIPLCVVLPMIGGMGIRGVWLAIALTDAILVAIIAFMVAYEFRKLPATSSVNR